MEGHVIKAQQTMQAALQEQTTDGEQVVQKAIDQALALVHETLESILRDKFKLEDGARLSSL